MAIIKCCKDCTDRHYGCHSKCEKYNAEKEATKRVYDPNEWVAEAYYRRQWAKKIHRNMNIKKRGKYGKRN